MNEITDTNAKQKMTSHHPQLSNDGAIFSFSSTWSLMEICASNSFGRDLSENLFDASDVLNAVWWQRACQEELSRQQTDSKELQDQILSEAAWAPCWAWELIYFPVYSPDYTFSLSFHG